LPPRAAARPESTNAPIHTVTPSPSIDLTANLWFSIVSALLLAVVATVVTERVVEPGLGRYEGERPADAAPAMTPAESRGLRRALFAFLGVFVFFALITLPPGAPLRNPDTGAIVGDSPFMSSLIIVIMLMFLAAGAAYG